jgi:hypothetical protein
MGIDGTDNINLARWRDQEGTFDGPPDPKVDRQKAVNRAETAGLKVGDDSYEEMLNTLPQGNVALSPLAFTNPSLVAGLTAMPDLHALEATTPLGHGSCERPQPIARPGNAGAVAEARISLERSLSHAAIVSTEDLARYIDEYTEYTSTRSELATLHSEAVVRGPEILANRLEADEHERTAALMRRRDSDQLQNLHVRAPLPIQQRVAVGEVAVPIAEAADLVAQFVPIAGQLLAAVEAATGRSVAGLGPELEGSERAINAALLLAPLAAKLLERGVRRAADIVRIARLSGTSVEETRAALTTARDVALHRSQRRASAELGAITLGQMRTVEQRLATDAVFAAQIDAASEAYADAVRSNRPWSWRKNIPNSASLTLPMQRAVRLRAIERGLIPEVPYKIGTRYPDFERAGVIKRVDELPQELWMQSDDVQFAWLDARIPGGRSAEFTWHHSEIPGRMELVPFGIHNTIDHIGGRSTSHWAHAPR